MKAKYWIALGIASVITIGALTGCVGTPDGGQGIEYIEEMDDLRFEEFKLFLQLGVQIGARNLVAEGVVTQVDLDLAASALDIVCNEPVVDTARGVLTPMYLSFPKLKDNYLAYPVE